MEYRGKITMHEIALSYCQVVKKGSHTARLVFTQRYFSYRFLLIGDLDEYPVLIVLFRGISPLACVASVSSRGSSRKLGQEQKKNMNDGGGGGERRNSIGNACYAG